jgi:hypothetical protein
MMNNQVPAPDIDKLIKIILLIGRQFNISKDILYYVLLPCVMGILDARDCYFTFDCRPTRHDAIKALNSIVKIKALKYDDSRGIGWFRCAKYIDSQKFRDMENYIGVVDTKELKVSIGRAGVKAEYTPLEFVTY